MRSRSDSRVGTSKGRRAAVALGVGALLGVFVIHPTTMAIYWFEFRADMVAEAAGLGAFIIDRMLMSFTWSMLPMTLLFAALGALCGASYLVVDAKLRRSRRLISHLEAEMARDVPKLIEGGETAHVEFKATARWDIRQGRVNKALADVIAKTLAAFANHEGGSLLIGVEDSGEIRGLDLDYRTLKSADRDGYTRFVMTLVRERLGGHVCRLVHVLFLEIDGNDVCRVVVEPSDEPVFFQDGSDARLFVRTGNASRDLDARETLQYVRARFGPGHAGRAAAAHHDDRP